VRVLSAVPPQVATRLSRHALGQVARFSPGGLVAGLGLAGCVWSQIDHVRLMAWLAGCDALILLAVAAARLALRSDRPEAIRRAEWTVGVTYAVQGILVGLLPVLVPADDPLTDAVFALFAVASATATLVISGPSLLLFLTCQVAMMGSLVATTLVGLAGLPRSVGVVEALFVVVLVMARAEHVAGIRQAAAHAAVAEQLAADLAAERDRTLAANAELAELNEQLTHQAGHDTLTGLANRELFLSHLEVALPRARRLGLHAAVLFVDLDRFKVVNDASGHAVGDRLLQLVAARALAAVRGGDVVARHGGDEFTILLPAVGWVQDALDVAERLRVALDEPFDVDGQRIDTSASIGIALDTVATDQGEDLLRHADAALYRAKDGGRNRIEVFDESLRNSTRRRLSDEAELREAIDQGQIVPWLQPVVELRTGAIVGAEALARWVHPERGVLLPGAFFELAVESGVSGRLGASVARQSMALRRRFESLVSPDFRLAINVAARALTLEAIVDAIADMSDDCGTAPGGITIEITEHSVITNLPAAREALTRARALGFSVALDDFGTGYSALSLLRDLPLDTIKIDRSFVRGMAENPADAAVIASVLDLAGRLGLRAIAEGVESDQDAERLMAAGAFLAQGFRYSRAVPAAEFEGWLTGGPPWRIVGRDRAVARGDSR
jgi:diguanylate cyclase (GGDEF)-like protein